MIPVKIEGDNYIIKNIDYNDLNDVLQCINQSEDNYKTLGRNQFLTYNDITQRYLETLTNSLEYFCGIFIDNSLKGIVKGRIENKTSKELWIMSIIILNEYRRQGLGSSVIKSIEEYFLYNYAVNKFCALVMEDNLMGQSFWHRNNYKIKRVTKSAMLSDDKGMVIFEKNGVR